MSKKEREGYSAKREGEGDGGERDVLRNTEECKSAHHASHVPVR